MTARRIPPAFTPAVSDHDLSDGQRVRIMSVEDLTLMVEPAEEDQPKGKA